MLKAINRKIALVALGLYVVEAAALAVSRFSTFSLLRLSQESVLNGHSPHLQTLGSVFFESQNFGYSVHMLFFALGATLFYYLFFKSGFIPRGLAILGLIAAPLAIILICTWLIYGNGWEVLGHVFGKFWYLSDFNRVQILLVCAFIYRLRHVFTLFLLLVRKIEWSEVLGALVFIYNQFLGSRIPIADGDDICFLPHSRPGFIFG
jgi:uncharacterized protein DUF4386